MNSTENKELEYTPLARVGGLPPRRPVETPAPEPAAAAAPPLFTPLTSLVAAQPGTTFLCPHCRVSLIAPGGEHSGLCPVCGHLIAELPKPPLPLLPLPLTAADQVPVMLLVPGAAPMVAVPPMVTNSPATADPEGQDAELVPRRPDSHRITRTGKITFRTLGMEDVPDRQPEFDQDQPGPEVSQSVPSPYADVRRSRFTARWFGTAAALVLLSLAAAIGTSWYRRGHVQPLTAPSEIPVEKLRKNLEVSALETLQAILTADDPEVIASYLIGGEEMIPAIQERLKADEPFPRISEAVVVSDIPMNEADTRRGFSSLLYEAAPADALRLDRPLLSAAMECRTAGLGLLEAGAVLERQSAPAPRQAIALFAKRNGRQLLEWELFIQTWDRTLRAFSGGELGNGPMRFRLVLSLDKPVFENGEFVDQTVIRVQDPLHQQDIIRVVTYPQDPVVSALTPTERELKEDPLAAMKPRTATVELVRSEAGRVTFERLVCREFLGLGGKDDSVAVNREIGAR